MISIEQCKKHIGETHLSDSEVVEIRDAIYALVESVFDKLESELLVDRLDLKDGSRDNVVE